MFARVYCLTILILTMSARRMRASTSLVTSNEYMGELIDVLSNIGDILSEHKTSKSLDTLAGAVAGQQDALKSLIQDQQRTFNEILKDHHNDIEELLGSSKPIPVYCSQDPNSTSHEFTGATEQMKKLLQVAENRAKQIEQLSEQFEITKQEIGEQMRLRMEQVQTLKGETRLDLDQLRSAMEIELKTLERHTNETILEVQEDLAQCRQQANEAESVMNGQVTTMQQLLDSAKKSLKDEMTASKSQLLKGLDELKTQTTAADATVLKEVEQLYNNISMQQKTSIDSIKSVEEKATADVLELEAQILTANSKLRAIEGNLGTTQEQLKAKIEADRLTTLKKLEEGATLVHETIQQFRQDLTSYKNTTQQTTSTLDERVTEVNQGMVSALEKMTTEIKGTKDLCIIQTTQSKEQVQQATQKLHNDLVQLEAKLNTHKGQVDKDLPHLRQDFNLWQQQAESHKSKLDDIVSHVRKDLDRLQQQTSQLKTEMGERSTSVQQLLESSKMSCNEEIQETKAQLSQSLEELQKRTTTLGADIKREVGQLHSKVDTQSKTSMDSIRAAVEEAATSASQIKAQIDDANSKLRGFEQKLQSTQKELKSEIERGKTALVKKVEEYPQLLQQTEQRLQQELKSHIEMTQKKVSSLDARVTETDQGLAGGVKKMAADLKAVTDHCTSQVTLNQGHTREAIEQLRNDLIKHQEEKTQETTSLLASKVEKVDKGLASAVTKMKAEVEEVKRSCTEQTSQSESRAQQATNQLQSSLKQHEAKFQKFQKEVSNRLAALVKQVDSVGARTETVLKEAKASFSQELQSFKRSLQSALDQTKQRLGALEQQANQHEKQSTSLITTVKSRLSTVESTAKNAAVRLTALETQNAQTSPIDLRKDIDIASHRITVLQTMIPPVVCPSPFERKGNHCFHIMRGIRDTWQGSRARCQAIGGDLAFAFDAPRMAHGLRMMRLPHNDYWVGASRLGDDRTWRWINGAQVNMSYAWGKDQPDNKLKEEKCISFHTIKRKYLNDLKCERKTFFICQYVEDIYTRY